VVLVSVAPPLLPFPPSLRSFPSLVTDNERERIATATPHESANNQAPNNAG